MALIRWEPVGELNTIQNEMNRLFNTFFDQPAPTGRGGGPSRRWIPAMDLVETADHYVLRADLPGLSDDDVNIQLEDNVLTISGERKAEHEQHEQGYYRIERAFRQLHPLAHPPRRRRPRRCAGRTSTAACSRSRSLSPSRRSPGKSRSPSAVAQPTTPRRSRAPAPATRTSTAATQSQRPPNPLTAIQALQRNGRGPRAAIRRGPRPPTGFRSCTDANSRRRRQWVSRG